MGKSAAIFYLSLFIAGLVQGQHADERYRPRLHFSPPANWINDPNGMVYYRRTYHLFYQHHPYSPYWGPMHWGHATSSNLVQWTHQPIALYPDSLGTIFSGSAVVDHHNTSGFGTRRNPPLVAIFTHHQASGEASGKNFQYQSLAYSNDGGVTWTKYAGNPVLRDSTASDFRDPKVRWYAAGRKWIMTLAVKNHVRFYSSPDLKQWSLESSFGHREGAHGGVWECPDLLEMSYRGKKYWVLIVNMNPGAPNGGSGTQYFIGHFDGGRFTPIYPETRWLDYGPDNYAGVTFSNTGKRTILMGWMSNWDYAGDLPTQSWKNAMTLPRELALAEAGGNLHLTCQPVREFNRLPTQPVAETLTSGGRLWQLKPSDSVPGKPVRLELEWQATKDMVIYFTNAKGEKLTAGYEAGKRQFFIDRQASGITGFHKSFARKAVAPRLSEQPLIRMTLVLDACSLELFADDGLTVLTGLVFPTMAYETMEMTGTGKAAAAIYPDARVITP